MRLLILLAGVLLATGALADDKPKKVTVTKELDKSSPVLMSTDAPADESDAKENYDRSKTRAQDYNSSRSNTTSRADTTKAQDYNSSRSNTTSIAALDDDSDDDSISADDVCHNGVDNDCDGTTDEQQTPRDKTN